LGSDLLLFVVVVGWFFGGIILCIDVIICAFFLGFCSASTPLDLSLSSFLIFCNIFYLGAWVFALLGYKLGEFGVQTWEHWFHFLFVFLFKIMKEGSIMLFGCLVPVVHTQPFLLNFKFQN